MEKLDREEYVEQGYFYKALGERLARSEALQDVMQNLREEILSTTKLPMAIDYLRAELSHSGMMSLAMKRLSHYFTAFQTFVIASAEDERGRFDLRVALEVLRFDAEFRATEPTPVATFFYQFETLCRNRLVYDKGLGAIQQDPAVDERWAPGRLRLNFPSRFCSAPKKGKLPWPIGTKSRCISLKPCNANWDILGCRDSKREGKIRSRHSGR